MLGIFDTEETKVPEIGYMYCTLRVVFEFTAVIDKDDDPASKGNEIIGEIQRRIREDIYWNNNAIQTLEVGNELVVDSTVDRQIDGAVFVNVQYRHSVDDPRAAGP